MPDTRRRWLDWFVEGLKADGYSKLTIDARRRALLRLLDWMAGRQLSIASLGPVVLERYSDSLGGRWRGRSKREELIAARLFIKRLSSAGIISVSRRPLGPPSHERVLAGYERHLAQFSRACAMYRKQRVWEARQFLTVTFPRRPPTWRSLGTRQLTRYIGLRAKEVVPNTLRDVVGHMRSFLRFLAIHRRPARRLRTAPAARRADALPSPAGPISPAATFDDCSPPAATPSAPVSGTARSSCSCTSSACARERRRG